MAIADRVHPARTATAREDAMNKILLIALAGAAGTLSRYWLSGAVYAFAGRDFPWAPGP